MPNLNFLKTQSIAAWHAKLNYMTATICAINVVAFAGVSMNKEYPDIRLVYSRNHTIVHTGAKRFNVLAAFAMANTMVILGNMMAGAMPGNTIRNIYKNDSFGRWGTSMFTMPVLHTACLLGIARVYDAWAVMSCVIMVILGLLVMWTADKAKEPDTFLKIMRPLILFVIYATFWGFVWFTGDAHPLSITCLLLLVAGICTFRMFFKGEKRRAPLYREAVTVMAVAVVHAGPPWIWVVSDSMSQQYRPVMMWSTFFSVALIGVSIFAWAVLNVNNLDISAAPPDSDPDAITSILLNDTAGDTSTMGIDSGSDSDGDPYADNDIVAEKVSN